MKLRGVAPKAAIVAVLAGGMFFSSTGVAQAKGWHIEGIYRSEFLCNIAGKSIALKTGYEWTCVEGSTLRYYLYTWY